MKNKSPDVQDVSNQTLTSDLLNEDGHIETVIPESQGDLADRAENEIESDLQWRIELIRRASREDQSRKTQSQK